MRYFYVKISSYASMHRQMENLIESSVTFRIVISIKLCTFVSLSIFLSSIWLYDDNEKKRISVDKYTNIEHVKRWARLSFILTPIHLIFFFHVCTPLLRSSTPHHRALCCRRQPSFACCLMRRNVEMLLRINSDHFMLTVGFLFFFVLLYFVFYFSFAFSFLFNFFFVETYLMSR